jgi:hypothetical protein
MDGSIMEENAPYLERIDSEEIKKLVDLIYSNQPENMVRIENQENRANHDVIASEIDKLPGPENQKKGLFNWK